MPIHVPVPPVSDGDTYATILYNNYLVDNMNKLLNRGHRRLTVAQFSALTSPEDGDEVYVEVDATNGVEWHLRYESNETTYFWRFLGGPALESTVATSEASSSITYAALTTAGPSVALPRAGDYDVELQGDVKGGGNVQGLMSYDIGGTGAVDADAIQAANGFNSVSRTKRKAAIATSTLTSKYKMGSAVSGLFQNRRLAVRPVRIRHDA